MLQGSCMSAIVSSIRQGWRFVNHDLGMVCFQHTSLVASSDGIKQTLHGFHILLGHRSLPLLLRHSFSFSIISSGIPMRRDSIPGCDMRITMPFFTSLGKNTCYTKVKNLYEA